MSISFGLANTLSNSQKLTPQMQQAIKLLQLSSLELAQEVQAKLDSNPLLERIEEDDYESSAADSSHEPSETLTLDSWNQGSSESSSKSSESSTDYNDDTTDSWEKLQQSSIDDGAMDTERFDTSIFDTNNYASASINSSSRGDEDFDSYQGGTCSTIQDHVRWQLNFKRLSETDTLIAEYLMDSMDDMGFIRIDIDELLQSFDTMANFYQWDTRVEQDEVMTVLRIIQSCDPIGVGARHLSECLAIQLSKLDAGTEHLNEAKALLSAGEHLVSNNIKALTELTGLAPEKITPALTLLRTLNPSPGLLFQINQPDYSQQPSSYDIPDVLVTPIKRRKASTDSEALEEGWHVRLNPDTLPKLLLMSRSILLIQ